MPGPVAPPRHRPVAAATVDVALVPGARDAAPLPEDDRLGPQCALLPDLAAAAAAAAPHEDVVLRGGRLPRRPAAPHRPYPPDPLGEADVLRGQAATRRERVRRRQQERRRDGPVRPDVDHRDRPRAACSLDGGSAGLGRVARRRGHLGRRRGTASRATALPGPAAVVGRRARAAASAR